MDSGHVPVRVGRSSVVLEVVPHWELTPREALGGYKVWIPPIQTPLPTEKTPFPGVPRAQFERGLTLQYGVSSISLAPDMRAVHAAVPHLPDPGAGGDYRSGVLVFSGDQVVGYYIIEGTRSRPRPQHRVWVHSSYYGQKLGARVLLEYQKRIPRCHAPGQRLNPRGCETFLAVRPMLYHWALEQGQSLPDKVLRELETGEEASEIRRKIALVRETGQPQTI